MTMIALGGVILDVRMRIQRCVMATRAQPGGIVISEIHYHPGTDLDTDDFIELTNTGAASR